MAASFGRAAVFAALLFPALAAAQDVTLTARDGSLSLTGTLQGFDGEYYRISTSYGPLTVDGQGVICDGPACPELTAPRAAIRLTGLADVGATLVPPLLQAFAQARGYAYEDVSGTTWAARLSDVETGQVLADLSFLPAAPDEARAALKAGRADLVIAATTEPDFGTRALALDALVTIVAPDNPTPAISTPDLARVLQGEVTNWAEVGGPDMPLVLHALTPDSDLSRALAARLGRPVSAGESHLDLASLALAVARDPWAIAVTGRAAQGPARTLPLTDSCGFLLLPTPVSVKAEDYPLSLPIHLLTPRRRLPLMARDFLDFLATPAAQNVVAEAGYIDRSPARQPLTADGLRLINAIQGAGEETTLADLKRLVDVMDGADRLSLTFRFKGGAAELDAHSQQNLADLARQLEAGLFRDEVLILAGFSDGSGPADANLALSRDRVEAVMSALRAAAPDLPEDRLPRPLAFGEALPMACDTTGPGRQLNRRVELWIKPALGDWATAPLPTDTPQP
jgi:phosphate transport system substrate-binding protein